MGLGRELCMECMKATDMLCPDYSIMWTGQVMKSCSGFKRKRQRKSKCKTCANEKCKGYHVDLVTLGCSDYSPNLNQTCPTCRYGRQGAETLFNYTEGRYGCVAPKPFNMSHTNGVLHCETWEQKPPKKPRTPRSPVTEIHGISTHGVTVRVMESAGKYYAEAKENTNIGQWHEIPVYLYDALIRFELERKNDLSND